MAIVEQRYIREIPISRPKEIRPGEVIILSKGSFVTDCGVSIPEGRDFIQELDNRIKVGFLHRGKEGKFKLENDEINSPSANLRTMPNKLGVYKIYRYITD